MQQRIKLEIITASLHTEHIIALLEKNGVSGYTVIPQVRGKGSEYEADGLGLNNAFTNDIVMCVCEEAVLEKLKEPLRDAVSLYGGVVIASPCGWLIH